MSSQQAKSAYFSNEQLAGIDHQKIPRHIAVIPDGNRRWAKQQAKELIEGHREGCRILMDIVHSASDLDIRTLSFFSFSTENWQRSPLEVEWLMCLIDEYLSSKTPEMVEKGVRLQAIGDLSGLPARLVRRLKKSIDATKEGKKIDMVLALNYGGRDEITRACRAIAQKVSEGSLSIEKINQQLIANHLDTAPWPDPDFLIRTSGENRISNYLLWQLSYSELYMTEKLWPEFRPNDLYEAVLSFQERERRKGS